MERLVNKYERGQIQHVDWLDRLAFSAIDKVKEKECERLENSFPSLVVEFCSFEHRVVFQVNIDSPFSFYASSFHSACYHFFVCVFFSFSGNCS